MSEVLVELQGVGKRFMVKRRPLVAVDDVSLTIRPSDTLSVVGESGSGKTTLGRVIAGLNAPSTGTLLYKGRGLSDLNARDRRRYQLDVQFIHQDPYSSLNPGQTIGAMLAAPLKKHRLANSRVQLNKQVHGLLEAVELTPASQIARKYPHELSGGQRQRAAIARALTVNPSVLVADEAVSMIDVSLRVSILNTLRRLREERRLAVVFITHDLAVARHFAADGRLIVMYLGKVVEVGATVSVVDAPQHPYAQALLAAATHDPRDESERSVRLLVTGVETPNPLDLPKGCPFHPRCGEARTGICDEIVPQLRPVPSGQLTACHFRGVPDAFPTEDRLPQSATPPAFTKQRVLALKRRSNESTS